MLSCALLHDHELNITVVLAPAPRLEAAWLRYETGIANTTVTASLMTAVGFSGTTNGNAELELAFTPSTGQDWEPNTLSFGGIIALHSWAVTVNGRHIRSGYMEEAQGLSSIIMELPDYSDMCLTNGTGKAPARDVCLQGGVLAQINVTREISISGPSSATFVQEYSCPGTCNGPGLWYVAECVGFTTGPSCLTEEFAHECAFGAGDECSQCPDHAFCPGGFRAWPVAGYWTAREASGIIVPCPVPAKHRCLGWSTALKQTRCASQYKQGSPLCASCAKRHYLEDGLCLPCPEQVSFRTFAVPVGVLLAALTAFYVTIGFTFRSGFKSSKLPVSTSLAWRTALDFVVWVLMTLQVFIQVVRTPTPGLPTLLRRLFGFFQALEADLSGVAPMGCTEQNFFDLSMALGIAGCSLMAVLLVLLWVQCRVDTIPRPLPDVQGKAQRCCTASSILRWAVYSIWMLLYLGYSPILTVSFTVLQCESLGGGTPSVWAKDTSIACFEGEHLDAAIVAFAAVGVVGMGLLVLSIVASLGLTRAAARRTSAVGTQSSGAVAPKKDTRSAPSSCWRMEHSLHSHLENDRPWIPIFGFGQPWLRPFVVFLVLLCSTMAAFVPTGAIAIRISSLGGVLLLAAALLAWPKAVADHKWSAWKHYPRAAVYLVSAEVVVLQALVTAELQGSAPGTPLSSTSIAFAWVVFVSAIGLPALLLVALYTWFFRLVGCFLCCRRPRTRRQAELLLSFLEVQGSEVAVRQLTRRFSKEVVAMRVAEGSVNTLHDLIVTKNPLRRHAARGGSWEDKGQPSPALALELAHTSFTNEAFPEEDTPDSEAQGLHEAAAPPEVPGLGDEYTEVTSPMHMPQAVRRKDKRRTIPKLKNLSQEDILRQLRKKKISADVDNRLRQYAGALAANASRKHRRKSQRK